MRRIILWLLLATFLAAPAATAPAHTVFVGKTATAKSTCDKTFTVQEYRSYAKRVYERTKVSGKAHDRLSRMHTCQNSFRARVAVGKHHRRYVDARQERKLVDALTPFGDWAIPAYIVMCESHGNFRARNKVSTAGGAYQIIDSTWYAHGGTRYNDSHPAAVAPPAEQHLIAGRIWRSGGPSQWLCS